MNNRVIYIDYLKVIAILLVITYHSNIPLAHNHLIASALSICVPIFFLVNGYLMLSKKRSIQTLLQKNYKILLLVVFWAVLSTLCVTLIKGDELSIIEFAKNVIKLKYPYCNTLWFLSCIFILNLLNPLIYEIKQLKCNKIYLLLIVSIYSVPYINTIISTINPFIGWSHSYSLLYYILGG